MFCKEQPPEMDVAYKREAKTKYWDPLGEVLIQFSFVTAIITSVDCLLCDSIPGMLQCPFLPSFWTREWNISTINWKINETKDLLWTFCCPTRPLALITIVGMEFWRLDIFFNDTKKTMGTDCKIEGKPWHSRIFFYQLLVYPGIHSHP